MHKSNRFSSLTPPHLAKSLIKLNLHERIERNPIRLFPTPAQTRKFKFAHKRYYHAFINRKEKRRSFILSLYLSCAFNDRGCCLSDDLRKAGQKKGFKISPVVMSQWAHQITAGWLRKMSRNRRREGKNFSFAHIRTALNREKVVAERAQEKESNSPVHRTNRFVVWWKGEWIFNHSIIETYSCHTSIKPACDGNHDCGPKKKRNKSVTKHIKFGKTFRESSSSTNWFGCSLRGQKLPPYLGSALRNLFAEALS